MTGYDPEEYIVENTRQWGPVAVLPGIDAAIADALTTPSSEEKPREDHL